MMTIIIHAIPNVIVEISFEILGYEPSQTCQWKYYLSSLSTNHDFIEFNHMEFHPQMFLDVIIAEIFFLETEDESQHLVVMISTLASLWKPKPFQHLVVMICTLASLWTPKPFHIQNSSNLINTRNLPCICSLDSKIQSKSCLQFFKRQILA